MAASRSAPQPRLTSALGTSRPRPGRTRRPGRAPQQLAPPHHPTARHRSPPPVAAHQSGRKSCSQSRACLHQASSKLRSVHAELTPPRGSVRGCDPRPTETLRPNSTLAALSRGAPPAARSGTRGADALAGCEDKRHEDVAPYRQIASVAVEAGPDVVEVLSTSKWSPLLLVVGDSTS